MPKSPVTSPKIAIVYDWLVTLAGGERVLSHVLSLYPDAAVHTLVFDPEAVKGSPLETAHVVASRLQRFPGAKRHYRNYLPFYPWAVRGLDLSGYDIILSISHAAAKGAPVNPRQMHLCYCFTPMRYAWDLREQYMASLNKMKRLIAEPILNRLKRWDYENSKNVRAFATISDCVAQRIKRAYGRTSQVIYPAVDVNRFTVVPRKNNYFITVSRLVPYKRVDLIVEAFSELGLPLKVVGDGPEMGRIRAKAGPTVELLGRQSDQEVGVLIGSARAFVFAAFEDFGIAPLEALACGTPVIGFGGGGLLETVKNGIHGVYFARQEPAGLKSAIKEFLRVEGTFIPRVLRKRAEEFSPERFKTEFAGFVADSWENFKREPRLP